jgi:hypothetical protein
MDWQSLLWVGAVAVLVFLMMRGCGGMAGGCGMGSRRSGRGTDTHGRSPQPGDRDRHRAA